MPNPLLLFAAQVVAIVSVLLLATGYLKTDPRAPSARVFGVMAVFIVFYLLNGMTGGHIAPPFRIDLSSVQLLIWFGINSIGGLFMIYCFFVFQEQQKFPSVLAIAFVFQVVLDFVLNVLALSAQQVVEEPIVQVLFTAMDLLTLVFVGFAIYWTLKGWRADLVEDRRIFRWFIIGVQGALIFTVVMIENFFLDGDSTAYAGEQSVIIYAIAVLAMTMVVISLRFDPVSLSSVIRKVTERPEVPGQGGNREFDVETFDSIFRGGELYKEAGLTIAMLAGKLNIPEYRLRAFIHRKLGFRNFNAMLHQYRIEDAGHVLSDRENRNVPVLTIALSVGYQSITPFNNAFREIMGITPSEYRKKMIRN